MIAWLKLLRLPNVFTAAADVMMGYLIAHGSLQPPAYFALLVTTSCLLYLSGMALNDVFDAQVDARERPERPIPSGRVSLRTAFACGLALLTTGFLAGCLLSILTGDWRPGAIAALLGACIVLYDRTLKRTPLAPFLMGACRTLNVLLGMSLAPATWADPHWLIALGIGIYITGVTIFARTEARDSCRPRLIAGLAVLLAGIGLLAAHPYMIDNGPRLVVAHNGWLLLWIVLALITARRCVSAILQPSPPRVQVAVRHCVQSIIVLDAALTVGYAGPFWGLAVLVLYAPTLLLTLWLDAT